MVTASNTSASCLRSFQASLAWATLIAIALVFKPLSFDDSPVHELQRVYLSLGGRSMLVLLSVLFFQALCILFAACSHAMLLFSIVVHVFVIIFLGYLDCTTNLGPNHDHNHSIVSNTADQTADYFLITLLTVTSFISVLHLILALTIKQSVKVPVKTKRNQPKRAVDSSNSSINALSTPLLESKGDSDALMLEEEKKEMEMNNSDDLLVDVPELATTPCCLIACLPVRVGFYFFFMILMLPLGLFFTTLRALYQRCTKGKASEILHLPSTIDKPMGGYACQMVFDTPFDVDKLRSITEQLSEDCGIDKQVRFSSFFFFSNRH